MIIIELTIPLLETNMDVPKRKYDTAPGAMKNSGTTKIKVIFLYMFYS